MRRTHILTAGAAVLAFSALTAGCGGGGGGFSGPSDSTQNQVSPDTTGTALNTAPLGSAIGGNQTGVTNPYAGYNSSTTPIGQANPGGTGSVGTVYTKPVIPGDPNKYPSGGN